MVLIGKKLPLLVRATHKWLALFVGIQALIWTATGVYMTAVHIDIIHGDHFVRHAAGPPISVARLIDPLAAAAKVQGATGVRLHRLLHRPTYVVTGARGPALVDALTGAALPPPSAAQITRLASHMFAGHERLTRVALIEELPFEVRGWAPPLWRADYDGWNKPSLYFSPATGELVTRRHELWRIFDFLFMLHIMDYDERENVNNLVLRAFTCAAVLMALSGAWLLLYSFRWRRRRPRP